MGLTVADPFDAALLAAIPRLRRYCAYLTRRPDHADDLVQDVLVGAIAARERFTLGTNMDAWLCTSAFHRFLTERRARRNSRAHVTADEVPFDALPQMVERPRQEDRMVIRDAARALAAMPATHREVVFAMRLGGETHDAYSTRIGISDGTTKSRLHRADKRLREVRLEGGA